MSPVVPAMTEASIDQLADEAWAIRNGNSSRATTLASEALEQARSLHYPKGIAHSALALAFAKFRASLYQDASNLAQESLEIFESLQDFIGQQRALNILGIVHAETGNLMAALKAFLETRKVCQHIGDVIGEINALNNLAIVYGYLGDYASALDALLKSLPLIHHSGYREGEMKAHINIATLYLHQHNYQEALESLRNSLMYRSENDAHPYASALIHFSKAYMGLGDYDKALSYGSKSLTILETLEDPATSAYALQQVGHVFLRLNDLSQAETYFEKNLEILESVGDPKGRAETKLLLAQVLMARGESDKALDVLQRALRLSQAVGASLEVAKSYQMLAKLYKARGQSDEAYEHLENYLETKEQLSSDASKQRFEVLQIKFEIDQKERENELYREQNIKLTEMNTKLERLSEELFKQANEDPLTGLFNRRRLEQELEKELSRVHRATGKLTVMICDIDNFKQINDRFSHQVGDQVLKRVGMILKATAREVDTVSRYGGEEFVILFPEQGVAEAFVAANRLREAVEKADWQTIHSELRVTLSMGLCDDVSLPDGFAMIDRADEKLYDAKRSGKNRVFY